MRPEIASVRIGTKEIADLSRASEPRETPHLRPLHQIGAHFDRRI